MIANLFATPVAVYNLKPLFSDYEKAKEAMIDAFPKREVIENCSRALTKDPAFSELNGLIASFRDKYAHEVDLGDELVHFDGHFNEHPLGICNSAHMHPFSKAVAVYYLRTLGRKHGDILLHDPRGAIQWKNINDTDERGIHGYRSFHRMRPEEGTLIVFPAYIVHSVETNKLDGPSRLSIGVNFFSRGFLKNFNPRI